MEVWVKCPQCDHNNPGIEIGDEGGPVDVQCDDCNCHFISHIEMYIEQMNDKVLEPGDHWDWDDEDDDTDWS